MRRNRTRKNVSYALILIALLGLAIWFISQRASFDTAGPEIGPQTALEESTSVAPNAAFGPNDKDRHPDPSFSHDNELIRSLAERFGHPTAMRRLETPSIEFDKSLSSEFEALANQARSGNAEAALKLGLGLAHCVNTVISEDSIDERVNSLYQTRRLHPGSPQVEDIEEIERLIRRDDEYCSGVTRAQVLSHFNYMLMAAENGNLFAQSNLTSAIALDNDVRAEAIDQVWGSYDLMMADQVIHTRKAAREGVVGAIVNAWTDPSLSRNEALSYRIAGLYLKLYSGAKPQYIFESQITKILNSVSDYESRAIVDSARAIVEDPQCCTVYQRK